MVLTINRVVNRSVSVRKLAAFSEIPVIFISGKLQEVSTTKYNVLQHVRINCWNLVIDGVSIGLVFLKSCTVSVVVINI